MPQRIKKHSPTGFHPDDAIHITIWKALKHRLPWLILGLFGGIFSASIIEGFEKILKENIVLAAFIPLIVYMADAVRTQTESFIIRDTALHPRMHFGKYLIKQIVIIAIIGIILSACVFIFALNAYTSMQIAITLALSLLSAILVSVITGLVIPHIFEKLNIDPANVSGPVATIIQDLMSIVIYFLIASKLL